MKDKGMMSLNGNRKKYFSQTTSLRVSAWFYAIPLLAMAVLIILTSGCYTKSRRRSPTGRSSRVWVNVTSSIALLECP